MKKILSLVLLAVVALAAVACKKDPGAPIFSGVGNATVAFGTTFNPKTGVSAYDPASESDITSKIEVSGEVDTYDAGEYDLTYSVKSEVSNKTTTANRRITVTPQSDVEYANGWYNYKFATADTRHTLFAAAEKWLLENAYAGIPLAAQSGLTIQHERIELPVDEYIPSFGWGRTYAHLTMDDAQVAAANGTAGFDLVNSPALAGQYTLRGWASQEPSTLNQWEGESTTESDYGSYINGSFYTAVLNAAHNGWEFAPELASGDPVAENAKVVNGKTIAKVWNIPLRSNLQWAYNFNTNTAGFPAGHEVLDAQDFMYTFRLALDKNWFRATSGGGDFIVLKIKGAAAYANAVKTGASQAEKDALWADFGIKATSPTNLRFEFEEEKSTFDIKYGIGWAPVHKDIYEADPDNFGTNAQHIASSGLFTVTYWEDSVGSRYAKNPLHPLANTIEWTGESLKILSSQDASNIALQAFNSGLLDAVGIPAAEVPNYAEDPRVLRTPGSSIWSLNINMVGTVDAQKKQFGQDSDYIPKHILSNKDFRLALYFSLDRDDLKTYDARTYASSMKISAAYYVEPEEGIPYRNTPQGLSVGEELSYETNGYDFDQAITLFKRAVATEIANDFLDRGTPGNYTVIDLECLTFDAASGAATSDLWISFAKHYFELLVDDENYVRVQLTPIKTPGQTIYDLIEVGEYDLALSSISGDTLDAASFLNIFCTDNRSGFLLNYGYDSNVVEIEAKWTENGRDYWQLFSFDGIYEVLNHNTYIVDGKKIEDYTTIDQLVEVFLGSNDLTEVKRNSEDGDILAPLLYSDGKAATPGIYDNDYEWLQNNDEFDNVLTLVLTAADDTGAETDYLFVIAEVGGVYQLPTNSPFVVAYSDSAAGLIESVLASNHIAGAETSEITGEDGENLAWWYEVDLDVFDSGAIYLATSGDDVYHLVLLEKEGLYISGGFYATATSSTANIEAAVAAEINQYIAGTVGDVVLVTTDEEFLRTGYITSLTHGTITTLAGWAAANGIPLEFSYIYEFTVNGVPRSQGDIYVWLIIIAGYIVYTVWL
jgi:ABC-type oligopeptide transport system substrate-binding subunit